MDKWLSIVGIGEDGWTGLNPVARALIEQAEVVVGGIRHLEFLPSDHPWQTLVWTSPMTETIEAILRLQGRPVCVLASADPMCYGIGVTLTRRIPMAEITIIPAPSAFSLACARLGWSLTEVETLSLCGRDPALIQALLYPQAQLLVLSEGLKTPAMIAKLLTERGFGSSQMTVLERMGGSAEGRVEGIAATWTTPDLADLNTVAITCVADPTAQVFSRLAGLPDAAFSHDGQITKREVRAVTLAALAPLPGQLLWDVGAGCGSVGIEWLRSDRRTQAIAIEQHSERIWLIAHNAAALGVPTLEIISGQAPERLKGLPTPDAIFIGGGLTAEGLLKTCWEALRLGGRLVANAVTIEGEAVLFAWQRQVGGELTRLAIQRAEPVGSFLGWKAMAPITQWVVTKRS